MVDIACVGEGSTKVEIPVAPGSSRGAPEERGCFGQPLLTSLREKIEGAKLRPETRTRREPFRAQGCRAEGAQEREGQETEGEVRCKLMQPCFGHQSCQCCADSVSNQVELGPISAEFDLRRVKSNSRRIRVEPASKQRRISVESASNQRRIRGLGKQTTFEAGSRAVNLGEYRICLHGEGADLAVLLQSPEIS